MAEVSRPVPGTIAWLGLNTRDVDAACTFYGGLLGWMCTATPASGDTSHVALLGDRKIAGIAAIPAIPPDTSRQHPNMWTVFVEVASLKATIGSAEAAGGSVLQRPLNVPSGARVAVMADPTGAIFALIQSTADAPPLVRDEPGGLYWVEALSHDPEAATAFYEATFGWKPETIGVGDTAYTTFWLDGQVVAGVMAMPPQVPNEAPSHWLVYLTVADIDRTVTVAADLGGVIARRPMMTGPGRIAIIEDPGGAVFAVCQPAATAAAR